MLDKINARTVITTDYESDYIKIEYKIKNHVMGNPVYVTLQEYLDAISKANFRKGINENSKSILSDKSREANAGLIKDFVIKLPPQYVIPKSVKKFLGGDEAAHLNLSGNQKITLSGGSTKKKNTGAIEGDTSNRFNLKMKQDLSLHLNGTIGKKILVKVDHDTPDANSFGTKPDKVDISYKGLDDEIVKSIKGGDNEISLPGLGSSFSTSGLFGVKTEMQIGDLKLTSVIGKDQAENNENTRNPNAEARNVIIKSKDFATNYFYIAPPDSLYLLYSSADAPANYPAWANNAFKLSSQGLRQIKNTTLLPKTGTGIKVFIDDDNASDDEEMSAIPGTNWDNPADTTTYHFNRLMEGDDYEYDSNLGLIVLKQTVLKQYTIGIIYTKEDDSNVGLDSTDPDNPNISVKIIKAKNQDKNSSTWSYQCRNIYDLGMQGINHEGFELTIFSQNTDGSENTINPIDGENYIKYLQLNTNASSTDTSLNGDETTIDLDNGLILMPFINPFTGLGDDIIYEETNITDDQIKMYIKVKGQISSSEIDLNSINILKNSVEVLLNNVKLKEGSDYIVDYDFGIITLLNRDAINSYDKLKIKWQNIPLFSLSSKTLIASDAEYKYGDKLSFEGFIGYQSEKVKEERPKIGGENRNIILTALTGSYKQPLPFLTKAIDWLPLVNTDAESKLNISADFGMSIPHIYGSSKQPDKNEAYVEDMESTLELTNLGVIRKAWVPASKPLNLDFSKAEINWFNLSSWRASDVYDNLSEKEGKEKISVMTIKVIPDTTSNQTSWAGLMKYLGNEVDISKKDYVELMIQTKENDGNGDINVHIDLGRLSEDFYTENGGENVLNSEDGLGSGSTNGSLDAGEDVGLDMLADKDEEGYDANNNSDPNHDDFSDKFTNNEYPYINRTEGNGTLDTEDLNNNGSLDKINSYFECSFPLSEISQWYISSTHSDFQFYRIPLKEFTDIVMDDNVSSPDLKRINYIRMWFDVNGKTKFNMAAFNLTGNKWQKMAIRNEENKIIDASELADNENFRVGVADNQRNPHYVQPKQTYIKSVENSLEQSVFVDYTNFQQGHLGLIYEPLSNMGSANSGGGVTKGMNLRNYKKIRFLSYAEDRENAPHLDNKYLTLHYRICSDSLNYYEIIYDSLLVNPYDAATEDGLSKMKSSNWNQVEVDFSELTSLKTMDPSQFDADSTFFNGKYRLKVVHEDNKWPTLTNIKMLMMGVSSKDGDFDGMVYFDDIRVVDAMQDIGYKFHSSLSLNLADLSDLSFTYDYSTPNFLSSAARKTTASLKKSYSLSLSNTWYLNKFFPAEWGLNLPLQITRGQTYSLPLYRNVTDDILREDLSAEEKKDQIEKTDNFDANIKYSMSKTPRSKILEYTLKKLTFNLDYKKGQSHNTTNIDSTEKYTSATSYNLDIPKESIDIKLWKNYRFYFFPNSFRNSLTYTDDRKIQWQYLIKNDTLAWYQNLNIASTRTVGTSNEIDYSMFSDLSFTYKLGTTRDLSYINYFKKIPIGIEKNRDQNISINYSPNYLDKICSISITPQVTYKDDHKKTGSADTLYYSGGVSRTISGTVGLKNSDLLKSFVKWLDGKIIQKREKREQRRKEEKIKEQENQKSEKDEQKGNETNIQNNENVTSDSLKSTQISLDEQEKNNEIDGKEQVSSAITKQEEENNKKSKNLHKKNKNSSQSEVETTSKNIFVKTLAYLTRISNVNFSYGTAYSSNYDQRLDRPEMLYQLGWQGVLEDDKLNRQEFGKNFSISTNFQVINNLSTTWKYSKDIKETWQQTKDYTDKTTFPDLGIRLSNFGSLIHMDKILESSDLSSGFVHDLTLTGKIGENRPDRRTENFKFNPLISWTGNWSHDVTSRLSANYSQTIETTNNGASDVIKLHPTKGVTAHVEWSFSAPTGFKIPFLRRIHFKNKLTPALDINFSEDKQYTKGSDNPERYSREFKVSPGATYEFNENIHGTLSSDYTITKDLKKGSTISNFNLNIIVEITF